MVFFLLFIFIGFLIIYSPFILFWGLLIVALALALNPKSRKRRLGCYAIGCYLIFFGMLSAVNFKEYYGIRTIGERFSAYIESVTVPTPATVMLMIQPTDVWPAPCQDICRQMLMNPSIQQVTVAYADDNQITYKRASDECLLATAGVESLKDACISSQPNPLPPQVVIYLDRFMANMPKVANAEGGSIEIYNIEGGRKRLIGQQARFTVLQLRMPAVPEVRDVCAAGSYNCMAVEWHLARKVVSYGSSVYNLAQLLQATLGIKLSPE